MSDYPASLDVRPLTTWRSVPGWPSVEASTDGRVRVHGVPRAPRIERNGYRFVQLGNRRARLWVHHAVLLAFAGPRPSGTECRHLDGDPSNNAVTNLAWGTRAQQIEDQRRHGTLPVGETTVADPVLRVVVTDLVTGETQTAEVVAGDYLLLATDPCHVAGTQVYPTSGTHVITVKGHRGGRRG